MFSVHAHVCYSGRVRNNSKVVHQQRLPVDRCVRIKPLQAESCAQTKVSRHSMYIYIVLFVVQRGCARCSFVCVSSVYAESVRLSGTRIFRLAVCLAS